MSAERIMELFAGEKIVNSLVEGVILGHEMLTLSPHALARRRICKIVRAAIETLLEILVPPAVITFAQQGRDPVRRFTEIEPASLNYHPGSICRAVCPATRNHRVVAGHDLGPEADGN